MEVSYSLMERESWYTRKNMILALHAVQVQREERFMFKITVRE